MANSTGLHQKTFLLLLAAVTIAFFWILLPFYGAVFWGAVLAIIFAPLQRRLVARLHGRVNIASLLTLMLVLLLVILPLTLITISLVNEGMNLYDSIRSGQINFGLYFQRAVDALPPYVRDLLSRFDVQSLSDLQQKLSASAVQTSQFLAQRALSIGQNTAHMLIGFGIMMYLLFFLLRDGPQLSRRVRLAVPLSPGHKQHLIKKFTMVVRATVKGNIAVAIVQGTLGGVIFAILGIQGSLLWGAIMAFLSLLPAVGAALIWAPVAVYFLLTGDLVKGFVLIGFGVLVIGMVDNVLRPILVGKDTQMPDYVVLISTLGGMALFGLNGFVIGPLVAALFIACWDLHSIGEGAPPETLREEAQSGSPACVEAQQARDKAGQPEQDRATTN
ncbi:AI-2E family transporter [Cupriavidus pampae]|uniref:Transport protein YdiK n=1 Tax=Cupriavidus pampae TaxID=659251 RepID=A0ABM8WGD0_9BURK|nr:AI-2E family transporter [Cupriavidus pampae]CAG9166379.1 Putative transport protein YdiK [Cupriavidus pampae]